MSRKTKEELLKDIHTEAFREFDKVQATYKDERAQCLEDRRFYSIAGAQWEGTLGEQFKNKLKFEINKVHLAVLRIINEYRNNRITVTFSPKTGTRDNGLSDVCAGLFRSDEQDSGAEEAFDNSFEEAVGGGYGAFRLCTKYVDEEDEDDDKQRIEFKPIFDADTSVFWDADAKRQDKADAKKCWVLISRDRQAYIDEYGENPADWPKGINTANFDWFTPDIVFLAEYYRVEQTKRTIVEMVDIQGKKSKFDAKELEEERTDAEGKEKPTLMEELIATGHKEVRRKTVKRQRVHKYLMDGRRIIEDMGFIAGNCIPVIPVYGKRWFVDNVERCMGHVRLSKDPQRLYNMEISKVGEVSAASSYEKPILMPEQIAGHQGMWEDDPVKNWAYMLLNPITDANGQKQPAGPIAYTKAPNVPPATAALLQLTEADLQQILGSPQQGEKMVSNISDKTVEMIQQRLDMQTFIYMDNMAKAMKRAGEVWLSMARDIYVEESRPMKTVGVSNETDEIILQRPIIDKVSGETTYENDLSGARFEVGYDVGPSSSSRRQATVRALKEMMSSTTDPETIQVLSAMVMMNMEGEGIAEVRDFFRQRLIRMGVVKPTEEEAKDLAKELENKEPSATDKYMNAAADEATAKATKANADTLLVVTNVEKAKAEVLEILSGIDATERQQILDAMALVSQVKPDVPKPGEGAAQPAPVEMPPAAGGALPGTAQPV